MYDPRSPTAPNPYPAQAAAPMQGAPMASMPGLDSGRLDPGMSTPGAPGMPPSISAGRDSLAAAVMANGTMGGPLDAPMAGVAPPGGMGSQTQPQPPMPSSFPAGGAMPQVQPAATGAAGAPGGPMGPIPGPQALPLPGVPQAGMPLPISPRGGY
jgi:hypothetical protein